MSGADETVAVYIPSETSADWDNEPCWCVECGWDGVEDDLTFTNDGVFVCPQCSSEDTDYYYSEEAESCVFCGSDKVVGVIDIVSLNEIHEATPLDKEQVYGYCARCADVKMAEGEPCSHCHGEGWLEEECNLGHYHVEKCRKCGGKNAPSEEEVDYGAEGSAGDQIISWEDGAGVSSPSMPPADIFWSESKFAALGEPDAPYDQGYDDQQDESIGERNITTGEQSLKDRRDEADAMDKKTGRKYHDVSTMDKVEEDKTCPACGTHGYWGGTRKCPPCAGLIPGIDMDDIQKQVRQHRYLRKVGLASEHHKGQGYNDELDESLGMSHKESGMKQSFKDRRDESKGTEKFDHSRAYSRVKAMDAESASTDWILMVAGDGEIQVSRLDSRPDPFYVVPDVLHDWFEWNEETGKYETDIAGGEPETIDDLITYNRDGEGWCVGPFGWSSELDSMELVVQAMPLSSIDEKLGIYNKFYAENMGLTQYILVDQSGSTHMMSLPMSSLVVTAAEAAQDDGYAVEIIGYSTKVHPWTGEPKDYLHEPRGGTDASVALEYIAEQNGGKLPTNAKYLFIVDEDMHPRYFKKFEKELNRSNTKIIFVTPSDVGWMGATSGEDLATHVVDTWNDLNTGIPMSGAIVKNDEMIMKSWDETGSVPDNVISVQVDGVWGTPSMFSAENMGLTQYVGSAGGSGDGTPVSYGGIALPESDVAAMVESSTENPMGASIGTVMGTMGAEDVPVVPDPSSFPQGDGRVLGQQTHQANLSPLHAEDEDVQMVKIQDPVTTGAKMALGVVALNATAIAGAALIGLALTYSARKEE